MRGRVGKPRKYVGGWDSANRRICIANDTFEAWRKKRDEMNMVNDDALARYLLSTVLLLSTNTAQYPLLVICHVIIYQNCRHLQRILRRQL